MPKFIVTKEQNNIANTENLRLLCEALGVCQSIVDQLEEFDADVFDTFRKNDTVTILTCIVADSVEIWINTDISDKEYKVCSLFPNEEGPHWEWVMKYIGYILEGEMIKRELNYKIVEYPVPKDIEVPFSEV